MYAILVVVRCNWKGCQLVRGLSNTFFPEGANRIEHRQVLSLTNSVFWGSNVKYASNVKKINYC